MAMVVSFNYAKKTIFFKLNTINLQAMPCLLP